MSLGTALLLISPIAVIEIGLMIFCLYDLFRSDRRVKGENKIVWAFVIVLLNWIGALIYLFYGREAD